MRESAAPKAYDLSPTEAAAYLGIHVDTLTRWARGGKVGCWLTPSGHRRYAIEDLAALLPESDAS